MKNIAIAGIRGVSAKYGGFETMMDNTIGGNCSSEVHYTVFRSDRDLCQTFEYL